MKAYLDRTAGHGFLPSDPVDLKVILHCYLLEKCLYELVYELNNRPEWVMIPLQGIRQLLEN
jgi:maltose alpha-D-glucosyltransferase/alpha-amylase